MDLFDATVPVFLSFLNRMDGMLDKIAASDDPSAMLAARVSPDGFPAGQQIAISANYMLRVAFPVAGQVVPVSDYGADSVLALRGVVQDVRERLLVLDAGDFDASRVVQHVAGFAEVAQSAGDFVHHYGVPNVIFHFSMGYAALRSAGLNLGKADFDGIHEYPDGFS